ncbi:MAG: MerR family transcriptional regulator, partial [Spirochaetaceae bacterium]
GALRPIGSVAAETGVTRDRIINWERDGLCRYPRSPVGYRLFGAEEIDRLLIIRSCRTAGFSITAIRRLLRAIDDAATEPSVPPNGMSLRVVADTPARHETELFPVFPTDTLPTTLEQLLGLTERLGCVLRDCHPERCVRDKQPSN